MAELLNNTCSHPSCGAAGTYEMPGRCANCGVEYCVRLTKGHEAPGGWLGAHCTSCGCNRVSCYPPPETHLQGHENG